MDRTPIGKLKIKSWIAIVIMFFVLLAVGMATYSWYIVSTTPAIKAVETYMSVVDTIMSIARATDGYKADDPDYQPTEPEEVGNNDASIGDITWGAKITSFQDNSVMIELPATMKHGYLETITYGPDGRLDKLATLSEGEMGASFRGEPPAKGIRYYTNEDGKICAIGLGVWVRINKPDRDLVVNARNVKVKNARGDVVVDSDKVGFAIRTSADRGIKLLRFNDEMGIHSGTIYDHSEGDAFPLNTPVFIELVIYVEGDTETENGLIAADVGRTLYINIESVTFYDNVNFDPNRDRE